MNQTETLRDSSTPKLLKLPKKDDKIRQFHLDFIKLKMSEKNSEEQTCLPISVLHSSNTDSKVELPGSNNDFKIEISGKTGISDNKVELPNNKTEILDKIDLLTEIENKSVNLTVSPREESRSILKVLLSPRDNKKYVSKARKSPTYERVPDEVQTKIFKSTTDEVQTKIFKSTTDEKISDKIQTKIFKSPTDEKISGKLIRNNRFNRRSIISVDDNTPKIVKSSTEEKIIKPIKERGKIRQFHLELSKLMKDDGKKEESCSKSTRHEKVNREEKFSPRSTRHEKVNREENFSPRFSPRFTRHEKMNKDEQLSPRFSPRFKSVEDNKINSFHLELSKCGKSLDDEQFSHRITNSNAKQLAYLIILVKRLGWCSCYDKSVIKPNLKQTKTYIKSRIDRFKFLFPKSSTLFDEINTNNVISIINPLLMKFWNTQIIGNNDLASLLQLDTKK